MLRAVVSHQWRHYGFPSVNSGIRNTIGWRNRIRDSLAVNYIHWKSESKQDSGDNRQQNEANIAKKASLRHENAAC